MNQDYTGCWTALATPFKKDYTVDWQELERNVEFQVSQGLTGLLPMGSTGESATVTHEEHSKIIEKVNEKASQRVKVLAGTGSNSTEEAVYETSLAQQAGVDACLLVDCYYNKPSSLELRKEYYDVILTEFPDMDFIAYAIPGRSVTVTLPEDLAILHAEHPNLVAVKEATGDFDRMRRTREITPETFNIISGDDPNTYAMMSEQEIGASGVISVISNICPAPIEEYTRLLLKNNAYDAKIIHEGLSPLFNIVGVTTTETQRLPDGTEVQVEVKTPNPVPLKAMMAGLGMQENLCKRPMGRLTRQGIDLVRQALQAVWEDNPDYLEPIQDHYDVDIDERLEDDSLWSRLSY